MANTPLELAQEVKPFEYKPFVLDKEKYSDVEETPYGFIYNVNGHSITDHNALYRKYMPDVVKEGTDYGWTVVDSSGPNDELYMPSFDEAYKYAKRIK